MGRLTAEEAIERINKQAVTSIQIRNQLQEMAENNKISPNEYWKALKIVGLPKTESEKTDEYAILNK